MSDESVFQPDPAGESEKPATIALPDSVKDMIGEGKKYADVSKALEALGHSQTHIAKIEQENRELREKASQDTGITQADVLRTVQELLEAERNKTPGAVAQVDEAALAGLVDRTLTQREQAIVKKANRDSVEKVLKEKYAEKAKEHLESVAKELGVGVQFLASMSETSPEAAMKLLGLSGQKPVANALSSNGTVNTSALRSNKPLTPPAKSVMRGASMADIVEELRRHHPDNKLE